MVYYSLLVIVRKTDVFESWLNQLRDERARARIQIRIDRVELGLMGDVKYFDGIGELRIDYGPGYRVYFVQRGKTIVILLCGGDKSSQKRDISKAKELAKETR
nr:type II toxin-antitoxin system RelE/ParE family toxin [Bradyrhizobium tropiciagri]